MREAFEAAPDVDRLTKVLRWTRVATRRRLRVLPPDQSLTDPTVLQSRTQWEHRPRRRAAGTGQLHQSGNDSWIFFIVEFGGKPSDSRTNWAAE
jgi:hypothetical protein